MANIIHARKRKDGWKYRVWSTTVDAYFTPELNEEDLRLFLLFHEIIDTIKTFELTIGERIERAQANGTSSQVESKRRLTSKWMREAKSPESSNELKEMYEELMGGIKKSFDDITKNFDSLKRGFHTD